ncbi:hypothetical protein SDJN02_03759, partial [Cucurbita argyrosperma subsp. argyrosperma]
MFPAILPSRFSSAPISITSSTSSSLLSLLCQLQYQLNRQSISFYLQSCDSFQEHQISCCYCLFRFQRLRNAFSELANTYYKDEGRRIKTGIEKRT